MKNINELLNIAEKNGFEYYMTCHNEINEMRTPEKCDHVILTATKGPYSGEVIDILYDDNGVIQIEHSSQFKDQKAKFRFIGN